MISLLPFRVVSHLGLAVIQRLNSRKLRSLLLQLIRNGVHVLGPLCHGQGGPSRERSTGCVDSLVDISFGSPGLLEDDFFRCRVDDLYEKIRHLVRNHRFADNGGVQHRFREEGGRNAKFRTLRLRPRREERIIGRAGASINKRFVKLGF